MADIISPEQRSRNMAAIHSKNTKPEVFLRKLLFARGYRYRIAEKSIIGHPDIFLCKYNTAVFVHGCFWHRHKGCRYAYMPKTRMNFWSEKFEANKARDRAVTDTLKHSGVETLIIWECAAKQMKRDADYIECVLDEIVDFLSWDLLMLEIG